MYNFQQLDKRIPSSKSKRFTFKNLETTGGAIPLSVARTSILSILSNLKNHFENIPDVPSEAYTDLSAGIANINQFLFGMSECPPPHDDSKRFGFVDIERTVDSHQASDTLSSVINLMNKNFKNIPSVDGDQYLMINSQLSAIKSYLEAPPVEASKKKPTVVVIEGNIGAGKSTLVKMISESSKYKSLCDVFPEPLEVWEPVLPLFYADPDRYGIVIQMMAMTAHFRNLTKAMASDKDIVVLERDPRSCNLFAAAMNMDAIPRSIVNHLSAQLSDPAKIEIPRVRMRVFVDATPSTCSRRIRLRNRNGENDIPFDYLQKLDRLHHEYSRDCIGLQFTDEVAIIHNEADDPQYMLEEFDKIVKKIKSVQ